MSSHADLNKSEIIMLRRLNELIYKVSNTPEYDNIPGAFVNFPLTDEVIKLNAQRKNLLLGFLQLFVHKSDPELDLTKIVIIPGISERYFFYASAYRMINEIDITKNIGFLRRLYRGGNLAVLSSLFEEIKSDKYYVDKRTMTIYSHKYYADKHKSVFDSQDQKKSKKMEYFIVSDAATYIFRNGILRSILYGDHSLGDSILNYKFDS